MTYCSVKYCHNTRKKYKKSSNITFHTFPSDPAVAAQWVDKIRRNRKDECWKPNKNTIICSVHFNDSVKYITKKGYGKLRRNAVPTKNLHIFCTEESQNNDLNESHKILMPQRSESVCQSLLEPIVSVSTHEEANSDDSVVDANEETLCAFSWEKPHNAIPCTDEPKRNTLSSAERSGEEFKKESHDAKLHLDFKCNECGGEIIGYRYTCVQCCDVDLCGACEASGAHPEHYVLRLPRPEPAGAVKGVLETLRGLLNQEPLVHLPQDRIKMEVDDDPLHEPIYDEPDGLEVGEEKLDVNTLWIDSSETQYADTTIETTSRVPHQTRVKAEAAPAVQDSSPAKRFLVSCIRVKKPKQVKPLLVDSVAPKDNGGVTTRAGIATGGGMFGAVVTVPGTGVSVAEADVGPPRGEVKASRGVRVSGDGIKVSGAGVTVSRAGVREPGPAPKRTAVVKLTELGAIELGETKISLKPRNRPSHRDK